jgi:hypothetical protein
VVGELLSGTDAATYETVIGGDCAANGLVTLTAGQDAACTVTNVRTPPGSAEDRPTICNRLIVTPRTLTVGRPSKLFARVVAGGKPVLGAQVTLTGPGARDRLYTDAKGTARFRITPSKPGTLKLATQRQFGCRGPALDRIRAKPVKPKPPAVTG